MERKYEDFESNFIELSKKTFNNFQEMIPINYKNLWMDGIEKKVYYLKLCGSGGGGFLIGLTTDLDKVQKLFPTKKNRGTVQVLSLSHSPNKSPCKKNPSIGVLHKFIRIMSD